MHNVYIRPSGQSIAEFLNVVPGTSLSKINKVEDEDHEWSTTF